jgi:hypothetical protein
MAFLYGRYIVDAARRKINAEDEEFRKQLVLIVMLGLRLKKSNDVITMVSFYQVRRSRTSSWNVHLTSHKSMAF